MKNCLWKKLLRTSLSVVMLMHLFSSEAVAAESKKPNVSDLIDGLKSSDKEVRREASYRLSQLGAEAKSAVPELIKALDDDETQVWFNSITALARIGPDAVEAVPALMKELEDSGRGRYREQAWYRASFALGSVGPAALPALTNALTHERSVVRSGAAKAISWIGPPATNAIPLLTKNLNDGDEDVREQSAEALGKIGPASLPSLKDGLKNDQANTRAGAAVALEWMGESAVEASPQLATALKAESDDAVRARMIHALGKLRYDPADFLKILVPLLRSDSEPVRLEASSALILMDHPATTSVPVLKNMVSSDDETAVKMAATYLGDIGPEAGDAVPALVAARSKAGTTAEIATAIDNALIQIGPPAVPELVKAMSAAGGDTNHWSVKCLRATGPATVPAMIDSLNSPDPSRQRDAIQVLSLIGEAAEPAIPDLKKLAGSDSAEVRGPALAALALAGAKPATVLPLAQEALTDSSPAMRQSGAAALASLGAGARPAIPSLINGLKDKEASVAASCARALGKCGQAGAPAVNPLIEALDRPEFTVREAVVGALGELGETAGEAVPALAKLLPNTKPPLQTMVAVSLGTMGASAKAALPELEKSLVSDHAETRAAALSAVAQIEPDRDRKVEILKTALDDKAQPVRVAAIEELGKLGRAAEPAAQRLYELTESSTEREQALEVLAGMRIRSVPLLVRALGNSDPYVRQFAAERLGQLGKNAKEATADLRKLLDDQEDFVKRTARSALQDIERAK